MRRNYIMAVDIGTQSTRAGLFDIYGHLEAIISQPYPLETPAPGWAQQDPQMWWAACVHNIRTLLQQTDVHPSQNTLCIGIDSQMHATIPLGKDGQVLVQAVQLWCDKRNAEIVAEFSRTHPDDATLALTANVPTTAWLGFKIRWMKQHQPEVYEKTWKFLTGGAYVVYRLTGVMVISLSEASGSFCMDIRTESWSDNLTNLIGIDLEKLPAIAPASTVAGYVTSPASQLTGLAAGTPVTVGASDFMATLLAAGIVQDGQAADISGTSCLMAALTSRPLINSRIMNLHHEIDGWVAYGVVETGGGALRWFRDNFCQEELIRAEQTGRDVYDILGEQAALIAPGAQGVIFFPYLLGERTLGSPYSRGVFFGLSMLSDRKTLMRAILEGITFELRRTLEIVEQSGHPVTEIRAVGGGAASPIWNQIRADIYDEPVISCGAHDGGIAGTALLAGLATGVWPDVQTAVEVVVRTEAAVSPNPANRARYDALFVIFKDLHAQFIPSFERLHHLMPDG